MSVKMIVENLRWQNQYQGLLRSATLAGRPVYDICRLQTADRRLQTVDHRLQTADCRPD